MANNERVSQLIELFATDLQSNDIFLVTDMSMRESKKLELGQLLLFIENSGSFLAYNSAQADTASYIHAYNVDGAVPMAVSADVAISSSWADNSRSSSYAVTASFATFAKTVGAITTIADSASYLISSSINGTASYAVNSKYSDSSAIAANLFYSLGTPNGTASWAMSSSFGQNTVSSSYALTASNADTASLSFVSLNSSSSLAATSASWASSSLSSSNSDTASYVRASVKGPTFITPQTIASTTLAVTWTTFNAAPYVPEGTTVVILDGWAGSSNTPVQAFINIRADSLSPTYVLTSYNSKAGSGAYTGAGAQGVFPIYSLGPTRTFQYEFTQQANDGITLRIIGYY